MKEERFGITSQVRRPASSVSANIAEGCERGGAGLAWFGRIATGAASKLDDDLLLARDSGFAGLATYDPLANHVVEVGGMLGGFIDSLALSTSDSPAIGDQLGR